MAAMDKRASRLIAWWTSLEAGWLPASVRRRGLLHFWRERILLVICPVALVAGLFALIPSVGLVLKDDLWPVEALAISGQCGAELDLVVLGGNMPGRGGHQCPQEILTLEPGARLASRTRGAKMAGTPLGAVFWT